MVQEQYVVSLLRFSTDNTRSNDHDTDSVTLSAVVDGLQFTPQKTRIENVTNGVYPLYLDIGPIIAASPDAPVSVAFLIINSGYDVSDTNQVRQAMNGLSDIAAAVCTAIYGPGSASVWGTLNDFTQKLNKLIFSNCDGLVAGYKILAGMNAFRQYPLGRTNPVHGQYLAWDYYGGTGHAPIPCHGDSHYTTYYSIERKIGSLNLVMVGTDSHLWTTTRQFYSDHDPVWYPIHDFGRSFDVGRFIDVSIAGTLRNDIQVCGVTEDKTLWHALASSPTFADVHRGGAVYKFDRVGIATVCGNLHVCGITAYDPGGPVFAGDILHTIREGDGSWPMIGLDGHGPRYFDSVTEQAGILGTFVDVSCAGLLGDLHVFGVIADGDMLHTFRSSNDGSWLPFENMKAVTSNPGTFTRVGIASAFNALHICGITADGGLWHILVNPNPDGTWSWQTPFGDIKGQAGNPGTFVDISCTGVNGELHVCATTSDGNAWHTIRHTDGTWTPFISIKNAAGNNPANFMWISATEGLATGEGSPYIVIS